MMPVYYKVADAVTERDNPSSWLHLIVTPPPKPELEVPPKYKEKYFPLAALLASIAATDRDGLAGPAVDVLVGVAAFELAVQVRDDGSRNAMQRVAAELVTGAAQQMRELTNKSAASARTDAA